MKTSTEIASIAKIVGMEKAVEMVAKAGFDHWDFSLFDIARRDRITDGVFKTNHPLASSNRLKFARELKKIGLDNGITCNQSHAPFPVRIQGIRDSLKYAIECTAEVGGKICIIHPNNDKSAEENAEMYFELLPFAKEHNVKIATENMWNWDKEKDEALPAACSTPKSFIDHINAVNDPFFVACLDIGHAEMRGHNTTAVEMIHALGDSLQALHLHDNDKWHDSHKIPFTMDIDFAPIVKALKDVGYKGVFTLEADTHIGKRAPEEVFDGVCEMYRATRKLADMFENL
ncbi:MAG: sugar phosphate isomerase/epimerase [Clostridia bacterium]|nr:sugar phosphate isomerase/epimerase [Clostridia bacterium]